MVEKPFELVWTSRAQNNMKAVYNYILEDSAQNAKKVLEDIITRMEKTISHPEIYGPDKYKMNNNGSYRAFEVHKYRAVYRITGNVIRVLRVRHTKMEPRTY